MLTTQVITNESGFLSRMFEQLARFNETLHLARELKRRGPDGARRLLQERGLMAN